MGLKFKGDMALLVPAGQSGIGGAELDCPDPGSCRHFIDDSNVFGRLPEMSLNQADLNNIEQVDFLIEKYESFFQKVPMTHPANGLICSGFGTRKSPFSKKITVHEGIDYAVPYGSEVLAAADGVVISVRRSKTYGLVVDIRHENNLISRYAHLSKAMVKVGERICQSERIALVGSSGRSTGPHLHFEVLVKNKVMNPSVLMELGEQVNSLS
jgi:murein DD-endopeptidase MepM/ murein hydrolase activator NlpD